MTVKPKPSFMRQTRRIVASVFMRLFPVVKSEGKFTLCLQTGTVRIAIIAQEKLGDLILLTPLLRNLKRVYPQAEIHIVGLSSVSRFFENDPLVTEVHLPKENYWRYFRRIFQYRFDLLFSPKDHPSTNALLHISLIRSRYKLGIDHPGHRNFFHHMIQTKPYEHIIRKNCAALDFLNIPYTDRDCRPYLPERDIAPEISRFVNEINDKNIIGVNLSAGKPNCEWSPDRWRKVIDTIKLRVVIFSMPDKADTKRNLEKSCPNVIPSPPTPSLYDAGKITSCLRLLISPDTSLIHVASAYRVPTVALYRADPVSYNCFYPFDIEHIKLISPSMHVNDISPEQVIDSVRQLLKEEI
ncbi:MAG: hypothetical protein B6244_07340 [Candidatus Cloacimonetes bacterium 4572_55]|nr:MAG: hypothetical protein B6244_07340 [Candidatus Cloacimonetes bacterium 4572_55]